MHNSSMLNHEPGKFALRIFGILGVSCLRSGQTCGGEAREDEQGVEAVFHKLDWFCSLGWLILDIFCSRYGISLLVIARCKVCFV